MELTKELEKIESGLRNISAAQKEAIHNIATRLDEYADFLEYLINEKEIEHSLNYAIKEGYLDPDGLDTPQQKLKAWKKLEADSIRGEMMAEDEYCDCEPDKMCEECKREEVEGH